MNIEELKLIIELVKTISGDATNIIVIYIIVQFIVKPLGLIISFFGFYKIVELIVKFANSQRKDK